MTSDGTNLPFDSIHAADAEEYVRLTFVVVRSRASTALNAAWLGSNLISPSSEILLLQRGQALAQLLQLLLLLP